VIQQGVVGHKRRVRRHTQVRWGRLCACLIIAWAAIALAGVEWQIAKAQRGLADVQRQMVVEQERAQMLAAEIEYRNSDEYIELVARRELGLVKPGEVSVLLGLDR